MKYLLKLFLCCFLVLLLYGNVWAQDNTSDAEKKASDAEKVQQNAGTATLLSFGGNYLYDPVTNQFYQQTFDFSDGKLTKTITGPDGSTSDIVNENNGTVTIVKPIAYNATAPTTTQTNTAQTNSLTSNTGNKIFDGAFDQLYLTFTNSRVVVYALAAFGLLGFAVATIFGKLNWLWLTIITVSLFILASAEAIVSYAVRSSSGTPQPMKASWVSSQFNRGSSDKLNLRDDSNDFNYETMLKNSVKVKDNVRLKMD